MIENCRIANTPRKRRSAGERGSGCTALVRVRRGTNDAWYFRGTAPNYKAAKSAAAECAIVELKKRGLF